jgi:hypothetical protein
VTTYALGGGAQQYWEPYGTARCILVLRYLWALWRSIQRASRRATMCTSGQSALGADLSNQPRPWNSPPVCRIRLSHLCTPAHRSTAGVRYLDSVPKSEQAGTSEH